MYHDPYGLFSLRRRLGDSEARKVLRNPKVRGPLSGAAGWLAGQAAKNLCDPTLRGFANVAAAGFSFGGVVQFGRVALGSYGVAGTAGSTGVGLPAATGAAVVGAGATALAYVEVKETQKYIDEAIRSFKGEYRCVKEMVCNKSE